MPLPPDLQNKLLARFDELIKEGEDIHKAMKYTPPVETPSMTAPASYAVDRQRFVTWRTKGSSLLAQVISRNHFHYEHVKFLSTMGNSKPGLEQCVSFLRGIRDDLE